MRSIIIVHATRRAESLLSTSAASLVLDRAELAWAAGFFDGEGSTILHRDASRPGYLRLEVCVPQAGHDAVPSVLVRYQRAVGGLGRIVGPERDDLYKWLSCGRLEAMAVVALLWDQLGQAKRRQANNAIRAFLSQYESKPSPPRFGRHADRVLEVVQSPCQIVEATELDLAWAAGFLDAEGCFGLARGNRRVRGPRWYRVRASAAQHGEPGAVPEVLRRLQRTLADIGRIERHGDIDDFKWLVEGDVRVQQVLDAVARYLSERKLAEAQEALQEFRAQVRLKGDAGRCIRGHKVSHTARRGGGTRRICHACARIYDRREPAQ